MIIVILLLALFLRLISINQSFWLDEAVQALTSVGPLSGIFSELIGDFHPPLYHLLMWVWTHLFGNSEISMRIPSVLFGVGTVYFISKVAMGIGVREAGAGKNNLSPQSSPLYPILAMVLTATSPYLIYYSQEARMYSLSAFITTLSSYLFVRVVQVMGTQNSNDKIHSSLRLNILHKQIHKSNQKQKIQNNLNTIFYLLTTVLLIYTDYYGWLVVLAQFIVLAILKKWRFIILSSLFIVLSYLPWLKMLITQVNAGILMTRTLPAWSQVVNTNFIKAIPLTFIKFSLGRVTFPNRPLYLFLATFVAFIFLLIFFLGVRGWFSQKLTKAKNNTTVYYINILIYYTFAWLTIPLGTAWLVSLKVPNFQPFRLLLVLPAFILLTTWLIIQIKPVKLVYLLTALIFLINVFGYLYYQFTPAMKREDWRGLVKYTDTIDANLLIPSESSDWPIRYYSNNSTRLVYGAIGAEQVTQAPEFTTTTIYYLRYLVPVFDPQERLVNQLESSGYNKIDTINYNQLEVWEYELIKRLAN